VADTGKRVIVDGVEFGQVFLFPRILTAVTAAMQPGRLIIALFMVVLLITVGRIWDAATEPLVPPGGIAAGRYFDYPGAHQETLEMALLAFAPDRARPNEQNVRYETDDVIDWVDEGYRKQRAEITGDDAAANARRDEIDKGYRMVRERIEDTRPRGDFEATMEHVGRSFQVMRDGVLNLSAGQTLAGARMLFVETPVALWTYQTWFAIVYGLVFLIVFAVGGGAISRMAAVQLARQQHLGVRGATDFALSRWGGLVWAQALPVLLMALLAGLIVVVGWFMRAPVLDVIIAIAYGLILILGFLIAFLLLGYAVGFPLLAPAVACENCDGADAMQRTYAYVVNRPLHILWYWAVALF
jgi:hypothetical protein